MKIYNNIKKILIKEYECEEVELESDLKLDLGLDSLSLVNLIVDLEESFKITFNESDLNPSVILKVSDLVLLVEKTK